MRSMKKLFVFSLLILATACREKYVPQYKEQVTGFLVVEGFINSGTGPTSITLSRSTKLSDSTSIVKETKAVVSVEGKTNNISFPLTETTTGLYTSAQLTLIPGEEYRLRIITSKGIQYASDYSAYRRTVDIDSVSWREENGGVQMYANAHDAQNNTKYYMYKFDETWEYHSDFTSAIKFATNTYTIIPRPIDDSLMFRYTCWQSFSSNKILTTSTEKLSQDVVSMFPLTFIEPNSWKLSVLYSINLKQYAMSLASYRFYEQLKKNTQQLGSIFDAQPSDVIGNIHNLDNSSTETVIGFVEVMEEKQKRLFISRSQLRAWTYLTGCELYQVKNPDSLRYQGDAIPIGPTSSPQYINFAPKACVDCTTRGVNKKPVFWP